jgi:hypothetical protein
MITGSIQLRITRINHPNVFIYLLICSLFNDAFLVTETIAYKQGKDHRYQLDRSLGGPLSRSGHGTGVWVGLRAGLDTGQESGWASEPVWTRYRSLCGPQSRSGHGTGVWVVLRAGLDTGQESGWASEPVWIQEATADISCFCRRYLEYYGY